MKSPFGINKKNRYVAAITTSQTYTVSDYWGALFSFIKWRRTRLPRIGLDRGGYKYAVYISYFLNIYKNGN